jgi:multimeric flavodoxin WrbA
MTDESRNTASPSRPFPQVRTGQGSTKLTRAEFARRYQAQFADPAFATAKLEIERLTEIAWEAYHDGRKNVQVQKAGPEFANPEHELSAEWLAARNAIHAAQREFENPASPSRILIICASPRTDESCPSEMSKTFRLAQIARGIVEDAAGFAVDFLDLSRLTSEYGRQILPCKGCVSTAMPLCHWPCSCYPNHYMGQIHDWMNELYPRWAAAHGIMILTPVHWFQAPSVLKLMIDRLVCADGGNPDPTTTDGKDAAKAKGIELAGWDYPKHLAGRRFSIVVHGDVEGAEGLRRALQDWLGAMGLIAAGAHAVLDRYVGYFESYAASHDALDADIAVQEETRNAARSLIAAVIETRNGRRPADEHLHMPRQK